MNELIHENKSGSQTNTENSVALSSENDAKEFFIIVKKRLLSIKDWHSYAGAMTASFCLTDEKGNEVNREPQKGDYLRIDIPAPGTGTGEGYDWVQIEEIVDEEETTGLLFGIRVRPAPSPVNEHKDIAHFFTEEATSSFIVKQNDNKVTAGVYGRNEKPNTEANTLLDTVRNAAVATGAITGFSKLQWNSLVKGLTSVEGID